MKKLTIDDIKNNGWVVYEYIRGSHCHGIATEKSDIDIGGVFIIPEDYLYACRDNYIEQVSDEKNDKVYYELTRWVELLIKSNPTILESLFVTDDCVTIKPHPCIQPFFDNREKFLSKDCFQPLVGYSEQQIKKASGYNKKTVTPIKHRLGPLDFCYTFKNQGTTQMEKWLNERNMKQKYCGLNHLPNMNQIYGVYYDYAQHIRMEYTDPYEFVVAYTEYLNDPLLDNCANYPVFNWFDDVMYEIHGKNITANLLSDFDMAVIEAYNSLEPKGYHGIVKEDGSSTYVRLDSIKKGDKAICFMSYNKDGYQVHCRMYKEYKEWEQKRNPVRYEENKGYFFDAKNMCECIRLVMTGIDLARDNNLVVNRSQDRELLLDIKQHRKTYEEIMKLLGELMETFNMLIASSTLPDHPDKNVADKLLLEARKDYYNHKRNNV